MATGRVPTTANSPLTAKGDLFTYSTAPARLAVGNSGEQIVADSAATTGLRYSATPSASNPLINSAFQVWQRGTSMAVTTTSYTADRWMAWRSVAGATVTRQTTGDTTNLPSIQYNARVQRDSGNTSTNAIYLGQSLETINSIPFVGKTVTISFYARKGANFSAASDTLGVRLEGGTGTDQNVLVAYTGNSYPVNQTVTLTTTWQRFTLTGTVATTVNELGFYFYYTPVGTAGAADYFEVTGCQIDVGSVALPFRTYAATIQGELAACQRYYSKTYNQSEAPGYSPATSAFNAINASTTLVVGIPVFKVSMRTSPTITLYSAATGTSGKIRSGGADVTATTADVGENGIGYISATGLVAGSNSTICYVASAEL